ncbi:MAG: DUF5777 family beta-barrel protein [Melioribacteraceae bacterium]|nr:DUF5777 family beta-barrel protein [Melioribacteraceae bacterium]MCF8263843.1 DUF5777 family beta-barrel protein [Melioribacteraceae bacterium]MCF8412524.1 DUF5777 family beta-barrel protein [Melioribacteraceae bacterium]MCF8432197.1 DUF5777 family beta-barrel protein [Melioribacteraceae bacterium]
MKKNSKQIVSLLLLLFPIVTFAQPKWERNEEPKEINLMLFHSTHVINLPTSESLQKGDWEFEISHRFLPPVSDGGKSLYGFDGPVNIRLALGYALTDKSILTLGRSNVNDNVDLAYKYKFLELDHDTFPISAALNAGFVWNTEVANRETSDSKNFQYYGQLVLNTLINKKLGIGIVPTYLYNAHIYCENPEYAFTIGGYAQYYISDVFSVLAETNSTVTGWRTGHNSAAFGIELETGGHFFKIVLSNNTYLNTSQFIEGAGSSFNDGDLHIGFLITRLLKF